MTSASDDALRRIASLSPYFAVRRDTPADARPTRLLREDGEKLVGDLAARLGTPELRVAASTLFFSYAARLWSVALGTQMYAGHSVALDPDTLLWRDGEMGMELALPVAELGADAATEVVDRQLEPLIAVWRRWVAPGALWGNAASALTGAARVLGPGADPLADAARAHPQLRNRIDPDGRRRSCCLFYRTPSGSYCGDCCLTS